MNIPTPSEPGIELPDEPGHWIRAVGQYDILVKLCSSLGLRCMGWHCLQVIPISERGVDFLPRGGWLRATAADPLRVKLQELRDKWRDEANEKCRDDYYEGKAVAFGCCADELSFLLSAPQADNEPMFQCPTCKTEISMKDRMIQSIAAKPEMLSDLAERLNDPIVDAQADKPAPQTTLDLPTGPGFWEHNGVQYLVSMTDSHKKGELYATTPRPDGYPAVAKVEFLVRGGWLPVVPAAPQALDSQHHQMRALVERQLETVANKSIRADLANDLERIYGVALDVEGLAREISEGVFHAGPLMTEDVVRVLRKRLAAAAPDGELPSAQHEATDHRHRKMDVDKIMAAQMVETERAKQAAAAVSPAAPLTTALPQADPTSGPSVAAQGDAPHPHSEPDAEQESFYQEAKSAREQRDQEEEASAPAAGEGEGEQNRKDVTR